jgi:3-dehydroquinate dehydratase
MYDLNQLSNLSFDELTIIAKRLGIAFMNLDKPALIRRIANKQEASLDSFQSEKIEHLVDLIMKYKRNEMSNPEFIELDEWVSGSKENVDLFSEIVSEEKMREAIEWINASRTTIPELGILIDPGTASKEEIASILTSLSGIFRLIGGSGIEFKLDYININQEVPI